MLRVFDLLGVVAIVAGLVATAVAGMNFVVLGSPPDYTSFHYVAPFLVAIIFLALGTFIVASTWQENYGNASIEIVETFSNAVNAFRKGTFAQ